MLKVNVISIMLVWLGVRVVQYLWIICFLNCFSQVVGRLLLTNFTMNFVIYGAINPVYRQGYVALINNIMCFKQTRKV